MTEPRAAAPAVVLLTAPLALGLLVALDDSTLVNVGGAFSYAVLITGALGSLAAALMVRRGTLLLAALPLALPLVIAALGMRHSAIDMALALTNAHPLDRGMIAALATGELTSLPIQALLRDVGGAHAFARVAAHRPETAPRCLGRGARRRRSDARHQARGLASAERGPRPPQRGQPGVSHRPIGGHRRGGGTTARAAGRDGPRSRSSPWC